MLVLAAAAVAKIAASGPDALRGWLDYPQKPRASKSLFQFSDLRFDNFATGDERNEDDKIIDSADAFSAKSSIVNCQNHFITNDRAHCNRIEWSETPGKEILRAVDKGVWLE